MKKKAKPPLEKVFQKAALQWLRLVKKCVVWRQNQGARKTTYKLKGGVEKTSFVKFAGIKGISDLVGGVPPYGQIIAVECKREGKEATPDQEAFLQMIRDIGGIAICTDNLDDLEKQFEEQRRV